MSNPNSSSPATVTVPEGVPEKFVKDGQVDWTGFAKSYTELEKKMGATSNSSAPAAVTSPTTASSATTVTPETSVKNFSNFEKEFVDSGKLSDESYKALETQGYDKSTVNDFIAFRQSQAEKYAKGVTDAVGGVDNYKQIMAWANTSLSDAEKVAYDTAIKTGDINAANIAVAGVKTKFEAAMGRDPNLVGGSIGSKAIQPFSSPSEAAAFKSSKVYRDDPRMKAEYIARLKISNF